MPPFDPARKLAQLCRRHGLPDSMGERFHALMKRAAEARPDLRARVVEMVDRQLAAAAAERASARRLAAIRDEACLRALAPLLHGWRPGKN
ncbi:MAG TPA: hypothetical protein VM509_05520 [Planctomycetota bacterium]|nr:hypothetical protein [Planctomycetota bacterium]